MGLPQPAVALTNICSAIFNNTLYTYSSAAFQALPLTAGAKWQTLPSGEPVTGGVCVGSTPADSSQAGLFIVGGKGTSAGYTGLQKFTYATGQWSTLSPETLVTQDRLYHGATYLSDSDKIFMYGGQQDGSTGPSTHAFAIQASAPYTVFSYDSSAPPTINPIVLQWSSSEAVVLGGSASNTKVMLFDPTNTDLVDSGTTLVTPITKDTTSLQAALITGDDNSKNLYTFDESVSPNQVSRIVLRDAGGQPVANAAPVKRSVADTVGHDEPILAARDAAGSLTLANWPAYNASLAPTTIRSGFSVAQGTDGMVVLAGGGGSDVLCMFNARSNAWQNATARLEKKVLVASTPSSSTSSSTSSSMSSSRTDTTSTTAHPTTLFTATSTSATVEPTSSAATSTTAAAVAASSGNGISANTILGIVLGSVGGLAVLALIIYFCIVRRKHQKYLESAHNRRASGTSSLEKDSFAFANDSLATRPNAGGRGTFRGGHQAQDSQGSFSSVAILMGRVNQPPPLPRQANAIQRNNSKENNTKRSSAGSIFNRNFKSTISKPIPQSRLEPDMSAIGNSRQAPFERGSVGGFAAGAAAAASAGTSPYGRSVTAPRQQAPAPLQLQGQPQQQPQQQQQQQEDDGGEGARRSSGWNRYWSGGSALNMLGFGSGNASGGRGSAAGAQSVRGLQRATVVSDVSSNYSSTNLNRVTQDSATFQPLEIRMPDPKPRFQRVNSGSPTIANFDNYIKEGMQGKIERSNSNNSTHSNYSSGIAASVQDSWDPTAAGRPWGADRAPSSAYGVVSNAYHSSPASGAGGKRYVPTGMSKQPQLAMADTSSDMSWLNLGEVPSSRV